MNKIFIIFCFFIVTILEAKLPIKDKVILYPVYSKKLDIINTFYINLINFSGWEKGDRGIKCRISRIVKYLPEGMDICHNSKIKMNLNNLLKFQDDFYNFSGGELPKPRHNRDINDTKKDYRADDRFRYNLLGKITINAITNKLSYTFFKFDDFDINNKIFEIKKNIAYLNTKKFDIAKIKKILDVDLLEPKLGKKLYKDKKIKIHTKIATNNLINCRFCTDMLNYFKNSYGSYKNVIGFDVDNMMRELDILFNDKKIKSGSSAIHLFRNIKKQGNIYKLLDKKYIAKTYEEWQKIVEKEKR